MLRTCATILLTVVHCILARQGKVRYGLAL
jgi:hypothetical protein